MFGVVVLVCFSQVITRYVFNSPLTWSEEMARDIHIWMILLASPICIRKGKHLKLDFVTHSLPLKYKKLLKIIVNLYNLSYCPLHKIGCRFLGARRTSNPGQVGVPAQEQDLKNFHERAGRRQDKEKAMERLRKLGYM